MPDQPKPPLVVVVDDTGKEHPFPPGTDFQTAVRQVKENLAKDEAVKANAPRSQLTALEPKPPGMIEFGPGLKATIRPTNFDPWEFGGGVVQNFNPMNYINAAKFLATTDPRESVPAVWEGMKEQASDIEHGDSRALGGLAGSFLTGPVLKATGGVARNIAPKIMEHALEMTPALKRNFSGAAQQLVDDATPATVEHIRPEYAATEGQVNARTAAYDAANPMPVVDPMFMADHAYAQAIKEGRLEHLGDQPGARMADLEAAKQEYLAQNTRGRNLTETIGQKRSYGAMADYGSGRTNAPVVTNEANNFYKGLAAANRKAALELDPELKALLSKEQNLMGALAAASERDNLRAQPGSMQQAMRLLGIKNPRVTSAAAIVADRAGQGVQRVAPAADALAKLRQLMASHPIGSEDNK